MNNMQDSVLHLLTNRASSFGTNIFPESTVYVSRVETEVEAKLRTFLRLRNNDPAYYLIHIMAAIYTFPEVLDEFNETSRTFNFSDYTRPSDTLVGGSLINKYGKVASFQRVPVAYPVDFEMTIAYKDNSKVVITVDDIAYEVNYTIRDMTFLDIDWPVESGLSGIVSLNEAWESGSVVRVFHQPINYPYKAVADTIFKNTDYISFLSETRLLKNMYSAQTDIEKVAILGLAISNTPSYVRN